MSKPLAYEFVKKEGALLKIYCSCNSCDRTIFDDEMTIEQFDDNGGYCPECIKDFEVTK